MKKMWLIIIRSAEKSMFSTSNDKYKLFAKESVADEYIESWRKNQLAIGNEQAEGFPNTFFSEDWMYEIEKKGLELNE